MMMKYKKQTSKPPQNTSFSQDNNFSEMNLCKESSDLIVTNLTCNHKNQWIGVDTKKPLLGWQLKSTKNNVIQVAYQIIVTDNLSDLERENDPVWNSGKIASDCSIFVTYGGRKLSEGTRYFWKVKVWDNHGRESDWSKPSWWQTVFFSNESWEDAKWIAIEKFDPILLCAPHIETENFELNNIGTEPFANPQLRKSFIINKKTLSATLSISGLGHYVSFLNGNRIGDSFLSPGWTDYDKTVLYNVYDVTSMLKIGENVIGAIVGKGFYYIDRQRYRKLVTNYGVPKLIAKLTIKYEDNSKEDIVTDESWKGCPSAITFSSIYGGEDYDANLEQDGWSKCGFDDSTWPKALISDTPAGKLTVESDFSIKEMEKFEVKQVYRLKDGSWLFDFGQNVSGIIEITVKGNKGKKVLFWPSELINADGTPNQKATGTPYYFSYILKGKRREKWKPYFTYYGFRYVQVIGAVPAGEKGITGLPEIEKINLVHIRNSAPSCGLFSCSNDLLNRIYNLINWAIKSNSQSISTDCPHREKLGWLGQTSRMAKSINFNYDMYCLSRKIVYDMIDSQKPDGLIPNIAPQYAELSGFSGGMLETPESSSTAVILPYFLYKWYGDVQIINDAWLMMNRYVDYLKKNSINHILDYGLGDWYDLGPKHPGYAQLTPISLTATAYYFYNVYLMAELAKALKKSEADKLQKWAENIRQAFNAKFFNIDSKIYSTGSQTAMSLPYSIGIVEAKYREAVISNLIKSIDAKNKSITAGTVGFHFFIEALIKGRASNLIYEIINRNDTPGYGFQLKKGATALTESWQALENVSNNHLMLGHGMEWFYIGLGGIEQSEDSIGFKKILIRPEMVGDLKFVKASFHSPYGLIRSEWQRTQNKLKIKVEIPPNTTATIILPTGNIDSVIVKGKKTNPQIVTDCYPEISIKLGSGVYLLKSDIDQCQV